MIKLLIYDINLSIKLYCIIKMMTDINIKLLYSDQKLHEIFKPTKTENITINSNGQIGNIIMKILSNNSNLAVSILIVNSSSRSFNLIDCFDSICRLISEFEFINECMEIRIIQVDDNYDKKRNLNRLLNWISEQGNIEYDSYKRLIVKELN